MAHLAQHAHISPCNPLGATCQHTPESQTALDSLETLYSSLALNPCLAGDCLSLRGGRQRGRRRVGRLHYLQWRCMVVSGDTTFTGRRMVSYLGRRGLEEGIRDNRLLLHPLGPAPGPPGRWVESQEGAEGRSELPLRRGAHRVDGHTLRWHGGQQGTSSAGHRSAGHVASSTYVVQRTWSAAQIVDSAHGQQHKLSSTHVEQRTC